MKALVISGGGSKGAFAGGIAEYLIKEKGNQYDLFVGASTGSLLSPMLASGNLAKAKEVYTTITPKDIFTLNPYKIKKKHGVDFIRMNHLNILRSFWRGNKTFGSSKKLRKTITKFFTEQDFNDLKTLNKQVIATVSNFSLQTVEYKNSKDFAYQDFIDWTWASANFLPFMSLVQKNHMEYGDGGFGNNIPVQAAIDHGAKEIDVIILDPIETLTNKMPSGNAFDLTLKVLDFLMEQNNQSKLELSKLRPRNQSVKINRYHTPHLLTENSLIFNKKHMKKWWAEGKEFAANFNPKPTIITPDN
jgi:predicted patatin/cPLA2 family phospholipase